MATIKRSVSSREDDNGNVEIYLRLTIARGKQFRLKSGLFIPSSRFKSGKVIYPRSNQKELAKLRDLDNALSALEQRLVYLCENSDQSILTKEYFVEQIDRWHNPDKYQLPEQTFFSVFESFLKKRNLSEWRIKHYNVLIRALKRFERYTQITSDPKYKITFSSFNEDTVNEFESFLRTEGEIYDLYPQLYEEIPADTHPHRKSHKPQKRGNNTIVCTFSRLRAFFNWCNEQGITDVKPFEKYSGVTSEKYGTPYYITIEERDCIAEFDLTHNKDLEIQRDIFIFQCLIGCRVSDLLSMTTDNVINGAIEYIAQKTKGDHPDVIRVPLNKRAIAILEKHKGTRSDKRLLPFISSQRYNDAIKEIFTICGITRSVTILNPTTGKEEKRPINEVASSHLARRTFIGNLYKKVKDPNLVGSLSGHKEGSKAFTRYRDIDEDIKKELVNLID